MAHAATLANVRKPNAQVRGPGLTKMVTAHLPAALHLALKLRAVEEDRTVGELFVVYLAAGLKAARA